MKNALFLALAALVGLASGSTAIAHPTKKTAPNAQAGAASIVPPGQITINGDVATPRTLKWSELAILPQQTLTVNVDGATHVEKGPYVTDVLGLATPNILACSRNDVLRWWILVSNQTGAATVLGRGEVDSGFGNRPAILSISEDGKFLTAQGPRLIVPGDASSTRDLKHVVMVTTRRAAPQLPVSGCPTAGNLFTPSVGSLVVNGGVQTPQTLAFSQLQGLTQVGQTVSFLSGSTPTTNAESGPTLADVLAKAAPAFKASCPNDKLRWYVEITGSDGYASVLSYGEIDPSLGNRNPLVSLTENGSSLANAGPRVVQNGDVRGGRLVSGTVAVSLFRVAPRIPVSGC
jgi:hypothetical protein